MKTLFEKILHGEIAGQFVYRDDICAAIEDINPQAPVHILLFPIKPIARLNDLAPEDAEIISHMFLMIPKIVAQLDLARGYRVVINNGADAGESIPHMHIHILGGRLMEWPPG